MPPRSYNCTMGHTMKMMQHRINNVIRPRSLARLETHSASCGVIEQTAAIFSPVYRLIYSAVCHSGLPITAGSNRGGAKCQCRFFPVSWTSEKKGEAAPLKNKVE